MSDLHEPLNAVELHNIRTGMHQSPSAMASLLGVNVNTYYNWERTGKIPRTAAIAIRFLASQPDIAGNPTLKRNTSTTFKARFLPGAKFGRLTVLSQMPPAGGSLHRRIKVRCDCGLEKIFRATALGKMTQCGHYCKATTSPHAASSLPAPPEDDGTPDLEADREEWGQHYVRTLHEEAAANAAAAAPTPVEDDEWEAGL